MIIAFQAKTGLSPLWRPAARGAWRNPSSPDFSDTAGCEGESLGAMRDSPAPGESALGRQWFWLHLFPQKGGGKKMESQARKKAYWSLSAQACRKDQQEVKIQLKSTQYKQKALNCHINRTHHAGVFFAFSVAIRAI